MLITLHMILCSDGKGHPMSHGKESYFLSHWEGKKTETSVAQRTKRCQAAETEGVEDQCKRWMDGWMDAGMDGWMEGRREGGGRDGWIEVKGEGLMAAPLESGFPDSIKQLKWR